MEKKIALMLRLPKEIHAFLRKQAFDKEISLNDLMITVLDKYKNKCEKKLT